MRQDKANEAAYPTPHGRMITAMNRTTTIPQKLTECMACGADITAWVQWEVSNVRPAPDCSKNGVADMKMLGLRVDHNCIEGAK